MTGGRKDAETQGRTGGQADRRTDGQTDRRTGGQTEGRKDGRRVEGPTLTGEGYDAWNAAGGAADDRGGGTCRSLSARGRDAAAGAGADGRGIGGAEEGD